MLAKGRLFRYIVYKSEKSSNNNMLIPPYNENYSQRK